MKALLLAWALMVLAPAAHAQWSPVIVDEMVVTYIDRDVLRGKGGLVRMWWLVDYRLVQITDEKGYFSRLHRSEFDCRRQRSRILSVLLMSEPMGQGTAVFEDAVPRRWQGLAGQPFQQALWDVACVN